MPTIVLPKPLPHQLDVLLHPARFKLVVCGRRWGKTATGLLSSLLGHGEMRGARRGAVDGGNIWWVAPTYSVASRLIWPDLKRACAGVWVDKIEDDRLIVLPGGGAVTVKSADNPDSLRGAGLDGVILDEAAFTKESAWKESIRPALSDRGGWAVLITTPNGRNWVHRLFESAAYLPEWARWQRPSSDNPLMTATELDAARLDVGPRAFAQEYEAQFLDTEGAEFPGEWFDGVYFDDWPDDSQLQFRVLACDPSKGKSDKSDFTAFVMLAVGLDGACYVDAVLERMNTAEIVERGAALADLWRPSAFVVESNQFQELLVAQFDQRMGPLNPHRPSPIVNTTNKITRIRAGVTPFLSRGELRFKHDSRGARLLVSQLQGFPADDHDDGPDALEMALAAAQRVYQGWTPHAEEFPERIVT